MEDKCIRVRKNIDGRKLEEHLPGAFIPNTKKTCSHNWKNHPDQKGNNQYCTQCGETRLVVIRKRH